MRWNHVNSVIMDIQIIEEAKLCAHTIVHISHEDAKVARLVNLKAS